MLFLKDKGGRRSFNAQSPKPRKRLLSKKWEGKLLSFSLLKAIYSELFFHTGVYLTFHPSSRSSYS